MSQNSQSQPLLSPEDAADESANLTSPSTLHGGHATTQRSTRAQAQLVLFNEDDDDVAGNTPPPPPLPGEIATKRRLTRSTTRAGRGVPTPRQLDKPATPITPSRTVPRCNARESDQRRRGWHHPIRIHLVGRMRYWIRGPRRLRPRPHPIIHSLGSPLMAGTCSSTALVRTHNGNKG
jgi:hypothetical protein